MPWSREPIARRYTFPVEPISCKVHIWLLFESREREIVLVGHLLAWTTIRILANLWGDHIEALNSLVVTSQVGCAQIKNFALSRIMMVVILLDGLWSMRDDASVGVRVVQTWSFLRLIRLRQGHRINRSLLATKWIPILLVCIPFVNQLET